MTESRLNAKVRIKLCGQFRVESIDGSDLTPRSAKAQGLLAMLAAHPQHTRARIWLQDKLWSDRAREQGAASLRQALTEIRRSLGEHSEIFQSDRRTASLLADVIEVTRDHDGEFLEGLDVRDPEFDEWLRLERLQSSGLPARPISPEHLVLPEPRQRYVVTIPQETGSEMERLMSEVFVANVASNLGEQLCVGTESPANERGGGDRITLKAHTVFHNGQVILHSTCTSGPANKQIWSGRRVLPAHGAPPINDDRVLQMASEAVGIIGEQLSAEARTLRTELENDPGVLASLAVQKIFSMRQDEQTEADEMLRRAFDVSPRGTFLAWRVFLRVTRLLERHQYCPQTTLDELNLLCAKALELEPMNSLVVSIVAYAKLVVTGEVGEGFELSRRASALNNANPFAWLALCTSNLYLGQVNEAHTYMMRARTIGSASPFKFWWDTGACLTATATGNFDAAASLANSARVMSPDFRPPLRYLVALNLRAGNVEAALDAVGQIRQFEPGFLAEQLTEDGAYPSATLRSAGIVSNAQLRELN